MAFRAYGEKPKKKTGRPKGPRKYTTHRFIASLWDRDFILPEEFLRDNKTKNESAIFLNNSGFKKAIKRLFKDLKFYGVMNLFWSSEESEALVKQLRNFLRQFENVGRVAIFTDYERQNMTVLNPDCKFMKVDLDREICEYTNREEYKKKNEKLFKKARLSKIRFFSVAAKKS